MREDETLTEKFTERVYWGPNKEYSRAVEVTSYVGGDIDNWLGQMSASVEDDITGFVEDDNFYAYAETGSENIEGNVVRRITLVKRTEDGDDKRAAAQFLTEDWEGATRIYAHSDDKQLIQPIIEKLKAKLEM